MIRKKNTKKKTKRKKRIIISVQIDKINDKLISVFVWTNVFFFLAFNEINQSAKEYFHVKHAITAYIINDLFCTGIGMEEWCKSR